MKGHPEAVRTPTEAIDRAPSVRGEGRVPANGSLLLDRFQVHGHAEGGFSYVLTVRDEQTAQWFALKVPKCSPGDLAAYRAEMHFWLMLAPHPNIVRAHDVLDLDGTPALLLELVGTQPNNTLRARLSGGKPLDPALALRFAAQIAHGLAHAGRAGEVAHLDLKPENLMISEDDVIKVSDFGLARRVAVVDGHYPRVSQGSWPYAPPERFERKAEDSRADIYGFGVILFEMFTGRLPFELSGVQDLYSQMQAFHASGGLQQLTARIFWSDIPGLEDSSIRQLISGCLQSYAGKRPGSFSEVASLLDRLSPAQAAPLAPLAPSLDDELAQAAALARAGRGGEAADLLNRLLVREPDHAVLWRGAAGIFDLLGETAIAQVLRQRKS